MPPLNAKNAQGAGQLDFDKDVAVRLLPHFRKTLPLNRVRSCSWVTLVKAKIWMIQMRPWQNLVDRYLDQRKDAAFPPR